MEIADFRDIRITDYRMWNMQRVDLGIPWQTNPVLGRVTSCRSLFHGAGGSYDSTLLFRGTLDRVKNVLQLVEAKINVPEELRSTVERVTLVGSAKDLCPRSTWLHITHPWWNQQPLIFNSLLTILVRRSRVAKTLDDLYGHPYLRQTYKAFNAFLSGKTRLKSSTNAIRQGMWANTMSDSNSNYEKLNYPGKV